MSSPKRKVPTRRRHSGSGIFRDKIPVYSTRAGRQFVRPSDVMLSQETKADIKRLNEVSVEDSPEEDGSEAPSDFCAHA